MKSIYFGIALTLIAAAAIATLVAYPHLSAEVPTHWGIHDQVNGYSPKWVLLLLGPGVMAFVTLIIYAMPWLSPKHFEVASFRPTSLYIMMLMVVSLGYFYAILLWSDLGHAIDVGRAVSGGVCLLFALLGNVLGKVRRNFYIGVRTPWALANERVWNATHRFAAKTFVFAGLFGLTFTLLGYDFWPVMVAVSLGALSPIVYSLMVYKQMERRGEL